MRNTEKQLTFEGAEIGFRNFEGREGMYNKKGDRSFVVFLEENDANELYSKGWNVKFPKDNDNIDPEDDVRNPYLQITVALDSMYPAQVWMISPQNEGTHNNTLLGEEEVGMLDWAELANVDLVVRPYNWEVNGKTGVKAYLKAGYFEIVTDEFAMKYGI